jgi:hypothetical protein
MHALSAVHARQTMLFKTDPKCVPEQSNGSPSAATARGHYV